MAAGLCLMAKHVCIMKEDRRHRQIHRKKHQLTFMGKHDGDTQASFYTEKNMSTSREQEANAAQGD